MSGDWAQYPDTTVRETYPPAPTTGGSPNKEVSDAVIGVVAARHAGAVQQEAEFRARQRMRRLQTRGAAAMRDPEETLVAPPLALPDDPALDEFKAAGWFG